MRTFALRLLVLGCTLPGIAAAQRDAPLEPPLAPEAPPPPPDSGAPARPAVPPPALPPPPPSLLREGDTPMFRTIVRSYRPSPEYTQDRNFTSTRLWRLDPGSYTVESWFRTRIFPERDGARPPAEFLWQVEGEFGLNKHLQLDVYANFTYNVAEETGQRAFQYEGAQIEARISFGSYYGQIPTNPVLYLEWHPRRAEPDRAEIRMLLGGLATRWLFLAANPYFETNVEPTATSTAVSDNLGQPAIRTTSKFVGDMEVGTTLAMGFLVNRYLRLSAETKIGGDMLGDEDNKLHFVWFLGPGFILRPLGNNYLKISGICMFAMPGTDLAAGAQQFEPLLIVGSTF